MRIKSLAVFTLFLLCMAVAVLAKPPVPTPTGPYNITFQLVNNLSQPVTFMGGMMLFLATAKDYYSKELENQHLSFNVEVPPGGRVTHTISGKSDWNRFIVQHQLSISVWGVGRELCSTSHRGEKWQNFVVTVNPAGPTITITR